MTASPNTSQLGAVNWSFSGIGTALPGMPNGTVTTTISDSFVVGHPEWRVQFPKDPRTAQNTVTAATEQNGGTRLTFQDGHSTFVATSNRDMSTLFEFDASTGHSVKTIYDKDGNYVITIDSERGLVNVNDGWGGNNPFSAANGGWGWGTTGFGGWNAWASGGGEGGGGGGGGGCGSLLIRCMLVL
jgi:hypothetical protein